MRAAAVTFGRLFRSSRGCVDLPTPPLDVDPSACEPGLEWHNEFFQCQKFRRAHVEFLHVPDRLAVLHVCAFPHLNDNSAIFGFDMIAGPARVTGIFLDLSWTTELPPKVRLRDITECGKPFEKARCLPEWGSIFSPDMVAIRPSDMEEVEYAIMCGHAALDRLTNSPHTDSVQDVAAGQSAYIAGQRKNEHTQRMLASFIGVRAAKQFIETVLFPDTPVTA